jgi:hypothetical protein
MNFNVGEGDTLIYVCSNTLYYSVSSNTMYSIGYIDVAGLGRPLHCPDQLHRNHWAPTVIGMAGLRPVLTAALVPPPATQIE